MLGVFVPVRDLSSVARFVCRYPRVSLPARAVRDLSFVARFVYRYPRVALPARDGGMAVRSTVTTAFTWRRRTRRGQKTTPLSRYVQGMTDSFFRVSVCIGSVFIFFNIDEI